MTDPFAVLGLTPDVSIAEVRAARRRLAFEAHPDRGGDEGRMRQLNEAFDAAIAHLTGRRPLPRQTQVPSEGSPTHTARRGRRTVDWRDRIQHDAPSFVIEALPAEAFEALLVVTSWIGEVLVDEPPYLLDVHLAPPYDCWCRLELVPDAGSSTVSLTVGGVDEDDEAGGVGGIGGVPAPDVEQIRDLWVRELNRLGGAPPP